MAFVYSNSKAELDGILNHFELKWSVRGIIGVRGMTTLFPLPPPNKIKVQSIFCPNVLIRAPVLLHIGTFSFILGL